MSADGCRKGRDAVKPNAIRTGRFRADRALAVGILYIDANEKDDLARGRRIMVAASGKVWCTSFLRVRGGRFLVDEKASVTTQRYSAVQYDKLGSF